MDACAVDACAGRLQDTQHSLGSVAASREDNYSFCPVLIGQRWMLCSTVYTHKLHHRHGQSLSLSCRNPIDAVSDGICSVPDCAGVGLYPVGAMLNHSCKPNAMQSFQGRRIIFRAMQPIAAGQEATISYVELGATRAERRAALLESYRFDIDAGKVIRCPLQAPSYNRSF